VGDLELLGGVQRDAGRLLAVAQRRVEDQYAVLLIHRGSFPLLRRLVLSDFSVMTRGCCGRPRLFPPEGEEEKKSEVERERHERPA